MKLHTSRKAIVRGVAALAGALLVIPALAACTPTEEPVGDPTDGPVLEEVPSLSFGVLRAPTGALAVVTGENGWFDEAGVDVEFNSFAEGGGPAIIQAMAGGTPDIALLNLAATVLALGQGTFDVQIVSVAANPAAALPLLAVEGINSVEDLRGKKVSSPGGGGQYYLLASILAKHGMTFDDIDFRPMPVGEGQAAFLTGQLDAIVSSANGTVLIKNNVPGVKVIWDGFDFAESDAYSSPDVIITTREAAESNPEGIARFLKAFHESGVGYLTDPATKEAAIKDIQDYMASVGAGVDDVESTKASADAIKFYSLDEARDLLKSAGFKAAIQKQIDFWLDLGVIENAPDVDRALNLDIIG